MPTRAIAAVALSLLLGYGLIASWPLLSGPSLTITSPGAYDTVEGGALTLEGRAKHTETLWLDGAPLLMDESGRFRASLTLPSGGAILSLTATDRFGREITERRSVFIP